MGMLAKSIPAAAAAANTVLRPLNVRLQYQQQWDRDFKRWAREKGGDGDPNDVGDAEWAGDLLDEGLKDHYLPLLSPEAVIVELGPGSGRLSRHLIGRCQELIVLDISKYVCKWMRGYLEGKGRFQVHRINGPFLPMLGDATVDAVVSNGVFEHLDLDETYWFLSEFARVLRPGGGCSFNFDSPVMPDGIALMRQHGGPGHRSVFRLHHPESIRCVAEAAGFTSASMTQTATAIAFADLTR
jgi:SAM-dependent methyltransferase